MLPLLMSGFLPPPSLFAIDFAIAYAFSLSMLAHFLSHDIDAFMLAFRLLLADCRAISLFSPGFRFRLPRYCRYFFSLSMLIRCC